MLRLLVNFLRFKAVQCHQFWFCRGIQSVAFTALLCSLLGSPVWSQEVLTEEVQAELDQVQKTVDLFFRNFTDKSVGPEKSLKELLVGSPLKDRKEAIATLTQQASQLEKQYGAYLSHQRVAWKTFGPDLMVVRYLYKCERFPVIWNFYFYRAGGNGLTKRDWALVELKFDADLGALDR